MGDMQHRAILNAAAVADADFVHVTADDGHGPDRAVVAHLDITDDHGAMVYPGPFTKLWCDTLVSSYICHYIYLLTGLQLRGRSLWEESFPKNAPAAHPCGASAPPRSAYCSCVAQRVLAWPSMASP